jgi:hypothetical protein
MILAQIYRAIQVKITIRSVSLYVVIYFTLELIILKFTYFLTPCETTIKITMVFLDDKETTNICTTFCLRLVSKSKSNNNVVKYVELEFLKKKLSLGFYSEMYSVPLRTASISCLFLFKHKLKIGLKVV